MRGFSARLPGGGSRPPWTPQTRALPVDPPGRLSPLDPDPDRKNADDGG